MGNLSNAISPYSSAWKGTHVGLCAPVERGPSQGARSRSTGPTWVFSCSAFFRYLSQGWGLIDLLLRASNEALLRARVPRAQKIIRLHPVPVLSQTPKSLTWLMIEAKEWCKSRFAGLVVLRWVSEPVRLSRRCALAACNRIPVPKGGGWRCCAGQLGWAFRCCAARILRP